ncbi:ACT domain-containing protein [Caloramator sp. E03]|uniref:ACT domain-containing protein n=1 Tax=Caloramator sp. E03 TaxID=2576307 RepID=UPI001110CE54|nr:ACT domain-containing protein [Caloramator sp. E03]QCX32641.1 ACT domain-containing protein [Caloramator sp. E03]
MKAFVTVIGKDKIGIIQAITSVLSQNNVNILDINQTLLQDYFTMIMFVDLEKMAIDFEKLKEKLENKAKEIGVSVRIQREDLFRYMHEI